LDFNEFCDILSPVLTGKFKDNELEYAFKKFDFDNSGFITVRELSQILSKIGTFYTDRQISDLIATVDTDKDGRLNYDGKFQIIITILIYFFELIII
jgi:Ca2+-binding EF-hand superfamily protein